MNISELREKSEVELQQELQAQLLKSLKLRFSAANQELKQMHLLKQVRRLIARVKTVLVEKRNAKS
ncbi:MAG: 50S ribosomal protein L29 [Legionellales bacterium]|nr:MAG: 50S ribosomal protein L29 [Legionellales bacterium]